MTADPMKCGNRLGLFIIPIGFSIAGGFVEQLLSVVFFMIAFIADGAINNSCKN